MSLNYTEEEKKVSCKEAREILSFNYEEAERELIGRLKMIRQEAEHSNNITRVRNIDKIFEEDLVDSLLDQVLLDNILSIIEDAERLRFEHEVISTSERDNILIDSIKPSVEITAGCLKIVEYEPKFTTRVVTFDNPESMRLFLYDLVGFEYQSHKDAAWCESEKMIQVDPLALYEEVEYGGAVRRSTVYNLIDDIDKLENAQGPLHLDPGTVNVATRDKEKVEGKNSII